MNKRWQLLRSQAQVFWNGLAMREKRLLVGAGLVLAGLLTMVATLIAGESSSERVSRRWWRVSLWAFGVTTLLMLTAVTVTLNLKGTGSDDSDTTAVVMPA